MIRLRCETQSIALLFTTVLFSAANLVYLGTFAYVTGASTFFILMIALMTSYAVKSSRGAWESLSVYAYDGEGVEVSRPLRRIRMRWSDVRDFRIQRSTGDASVFLVDGRGSELRLDFQLLGDAGADLLRVMFDRLHPLVESKLDALHREARTFKRRHVGLVPLAGSVTAGAGTIKTATSPTLMLDRVSAVSVKEVRKLTATQEYTVTSPEGQVRFLSFVDDSPLLLRHLRAVIPAERWTLTRASGVFAAKLMSLILVPVMAAAALVALAEAAAPLVVDRALTARAETVSATVDSAEPRGSRSIVRYSFDAGGERIRGTVQTVGTAPPPGTSFTVRYDPLRPVMNLPAAGQGIDLPSLWTLLLPALLMLFLSLPYAAATLAFTVRRDPFEEWIAGAPPAAVAAP